MNITFQRRENSKFDGHEPQRTPLRPVIQEALDRPSIAELTRCLSVESARKSIDWQVLLAIAASFALGAALEKTGAARQIATSTITLAGGSPWITLGLIFFGHAQHRVSALQFTGEQA